jgi:hypothetical protein
MGAAGVSRLGCVMPPDRRQAVRRRELQPQRGALGGILQLLHVLRVQMLRAKQQLPGLRFEKAYRSESTFGVTVCHDLHLPGQELTAVVGQAMLTANARQRARPAVMAEGPVNR